MIRLPALLAATLVVAALGCAGAPGTLEREPDTDTDTPGTISARGRLEPAGGLVRVAGPSDFVTVVSSLEVAEGDHVQKGDRLAVMDTHSLRLAREEALRTRVDARAAAIGRLEAELENARLENARRLGLSEQGVVSQEEHDASRTREAVGVARLAEARAELIAAKADLAVARVEAEMSIVRAPQDGQVLEIHARAGEKVGPLGILELGATRDMLVIAEVYETDATRVAVGQRARVLSPALPGPLEGTVQHVRLRVGQLESLGTDPAARADARVVEVEIRLDEGATAATLSGLEVEVLIAER